MCTNIPISRLESIITLMLCFNEIDGNIKQEIILQHHFASKLFPIQGQSIYIKTGLAHTSSVFSEIFVQIAENTSILDILNHHNIVGYFVFVDDIFDYL